MLLSFFLTCPATTDNNKAGPLGFTICREAVFWVSFRARCRSHEWNSDWNESLESVSKIFPAISYELRPCCPYSHYYCFLPGVSGGKSSSFGKVLRWRLLTNVMIPIAKVSATGRPIRRSDAVGLLLKKH